MNKITISGNLTSDAEVRMVNTNGKDTNVTSFTIAVSEGHDKTGFWRCNLWNREKLAQYLTKGKPVLIDGRAEPRSYEKDGVKRNVIDISVNNIELLGRRPYANNLELHGRLTRDAEIRETNGDSVVVSYGLAVTKPWHTDTPWYFNISEFIKKDAKCLDVVKNSYKRGTPVYVTGRLYENRYQNENGEERRRYEVRAANSMLTSAKDGEAQETDASTTQVPNQTPTSADPKVKDPNEGFVNLPDGLEDELPF